MAFFAVQCPEPLLMGYPLDTVARAHPLLEWSDHADLHLTLRFFLHAGHSAIEAILLNVPSAFPAEPFALSFQGAALFERADGGGVLWARIESPPSALFDIQRALEIWARGRGFVPDDRTYAPHVTLARYSAARSEAARRICHDLEACRSPFKIEVREFALMKRGQRKVRKAEGRSSLYETLKTIPLRG